MKKCKQYFKYSNIIIISLIISAIIASTGCATLSHKENKGPKLGAPTVFQKILNNMPPVQISGKSTKFQFGGDGWIARVEGRPISGGTFATEETAGKTIIKLTPTHTYSTQKNPATKKEIGWVKNSGGRVIILEYSPGPPASMVPRS